MAPPPGFIFLWGRPAAHSGRCIGALLQFAAFQPLGNVMERGPGQSDPAFRLRALAHTLLPAIERYYIGLALLVKNGPRTLSAGELENLCFLSAQRLSLLHGLRALSECARRSKLSGFLSLRRAPRPSAFVSVCGSLDSGVRRDDP